MMTTMLAITAMINTPVITLNLKPITHADLACSSTKRRFGLCSKELVTESHGHRSIFDWAALLTSRRLRYRARFIQFSTL
jgi:hypothetical protein